MMPRDGSGKICDADDLLFLLHRYDFQEREKGRSIHDFKETWKRFRELGFDKEGFNKLFEVLLQDWQNSKIRVHGAPVGSVKDDNYIEYKGQCFTIWSIEQ